MHAVPRRVWRPVRVLVVLLTVGGAALAADYTWKIAPADSKIAFRDWLASLLPSESRTADVAVPAQPVNVGRAEASLNRWLDNHLYRSPASGWTLDSAAPTIAPKSSATLSARAAALTSTESDTTSLELVSYADAYYLHQPTTPNAITATGTWTSLTSGNWGVAANWASNIIADGAGNTANFNSANLTSNITVTLESSRTIGNLFIGDTNGTNSYTISPSSGSTLTFDSNAPFTESVLEQTATSAGDTINANIFVKNDLYINNSSTAHAFNIGGNIASSGANLSSQFLWVNFQTTSGNAGDVHLSGNISNGSTGGIITLVVVGGTVTLTGTNTYTGSTEIDGGTLLINGDNSGATGKVYVYDSGTLGGGHTIAGDNNGRIGGNVYVDGGTITGGTTTSVGTLTLLGNAYFVDPFSEGETQPGTYLANLSGGLSDLLAISGTLTLGTGTTLEILGHGDGTTTYVLATFSSRVNDSMFQFIGGDGVPAGYTLVYNATDIELVPTAIPEPATWSGGVLALGAMGFASRRRLRAAVGARL